MKTSRRDWLRVFASGALPPLCSAAPARDWFYERGVPVRFRRGATGFVRDGARWVAKK